MLASGAELRRIASYKDSLSHFELGLRCITCPEQDSSPELSHWVHERFGFALNNICMPLGFSYIVGESADKWPSKVGSMGRAIPGHRVAILDEAGQPVDTDKFGFLCVHQENKESDPDPALSKHFWQQGQLQELAPLAQNWYNTGIRARQDKEGYFWREPSTLTTFS